MWKLAFLTINGSPGNDDLTAGQSFDAVSETYEIVTEINGDYGDDTLRALATPVFEVDGHGLEFAVSLKGEAGNDTLIGGRLADNLEGGDGNDTLIGGAGPDLLRGGQGDDRLVAGGSSGAMPDSDYLDGGDGSDTYVLSGSEGEQSILFDSGTTGTDTLSIDALVVGMFAPFNGLERIVVRGAGDMHGNANANNLDFRGVQDMAQVTFVAGEGGDDVVAGNGQSNVLLGGSGDDCIAGGGGDDVLAGGDGVDTVDFSTETQAVHVDLRGEHRGSNVLSGADGVGPAPDSVAEFLAHIPSASGIAGDVAGIAVGTGIGTDVLYGFENATGGDGNDVLVGNAESNRLAGNSGDDVLDGGAGIDELNGGTGNDTYSVDDAADVIIEGRGQGIDTVISAIAWALQGNLENLTLVGSADIDGIGNNLANALTGNDGANVLSGGNGNDILIGNAGRDFLAGGLGNDAMAGGTGDDVYYVDSVGDAISESPGGGVDTVKSSIDYALGGELENLVLIGNALRGLGNALDNAITAYDGDNSLDGGAGSDRLAGGNGNDTYVVDATSDVVVERDADPVIGGVDRVVSSVSFALSRNVENLTLSGTAAIDGTGNSLANIIIGNVAANVLSGGDGDDALDGGDGDDYLRGNRGADRLSGGSGNDRFLFVAGDADGDVIVDFNGNGNGRGDFLRFYGYGPGAVFAQVDGSHWEISYGPQHASHEVITFLNGASITARDYAFT